MFDLLIWMFYICPFYELCELSWCIWDLIIAGLLITEISSLADGLRGSTPTMTTFALRMLLGVGCTPRWGTYWRLPIDVSQSDVSVSVSQINRIYPVSIFSF